MTLYGVSVGTGDPEDITVKALKTIAKCRVIAAPSTHGGRSAALAIAEQAADLSQKEIILLDMPMTRDRQARAAAHKAAAEKLSRVLETEDAALLCLGDTALYSTFSYIAPRVRELGHEVRCISGVCSPCAAANALGIPLVQGDEPLLILPCGAEDFADLMHTPVRKVIMKGGSGEVRQALADCGLLSDAYAAENVGTPGEKLCRGSDIPHETGYFTVYIV